MNNLEAVLTEFERRTKGLPLGHENRSHGSSAYNWRSALMRELREIAALHESKPTDPNANVRGQGLSEAHEPNQPNKSGDEWSPP